MAEGVYFALDYTGKIIEPCVAIDGDETAA
jgi:hypothetical protein